MAAAKPIDQWPAEVQRRLAGSARVRRLRRDSRIISEGEPMDAVMLIAEGDIEVSVSGPDGRRFTYALGWQGAIFGLLPLFDGRGMPHDLNALDDVTLVLIPFAAIHAELAAAPALWRSLAYSMAWRFRNLFDMVNGHTLNPVPVRLAKVLLRLARTEGEPGPRGIVIKPRLTQERLGELIGVTRQTAVQHLGDLVERGLVAWRYGRATLLDVAGLQMLAAEPPANPLTGHPNTLPGARLHDPGRQPTL
jgi:CRP-like cAMP-binding protein